MSTDQPAIAESRPRRTRNLRLRVLLALTAVVFAIYVFIQLDRSVAERFGPFGLGIYEVFHPPDQTTVEPSATGQRFIKDVEALGAKPHVAVLERGFLGTFGRSEWFDVSSQEKSFGDHELGRLADSHGERIGGLYLFNSGVTDAGLRNLQKFTMLRHLDLRHFAPPRRRITIEPSASITDAGLPHLKGLTQLWSLDLTSEPITDAGLEAIKDLPSLQTLTLSRTKVEGPSLARLKSLPGLVALFLDGCPITEDGLKALAGASSLQVLSLSGVPLTAKSLSVLKALPRLDRLDITSCGLLDEEVDALQKSMPKLKFIRH